jgi:hypothetical protein
VRDELAGGALYFLSHGTAFKLRRFSVLMDTKLILDHNDHIDQYG